MPTQAESPNASGTHTDPEDTMSVLDQPTITTGAPDHTGEGSPIYTELIAELGDPMK